MIFEDTIYVFGGPVASFCGCWDGEDSPSGVLHSMFEAYLCLVLDGVTVMATGNLQMVMGGDFSIEALAFPRPCSRSFERCFKNL